MANNLRTLARLRRPCRKHLRTNQNLQQRRQRLRRNSRHHPSSPPLNPRPRLPHHPPRSLLPNSQSRPSTSDSDRLPRHFPHRPRATQRHPDHVLRARPACPNSLHDGADFDGDECVLRQSGRVRDGGGNDCRDQYAHAVLADAEWLADGYQAECGHADDRDCGDNDGVGNCAVACCAQQYR
jgi:hypothetical protein